MARPASVLDENLEANISGHIPETSIPQHVSLQSSQREGQVASLQDHLVHYHAVRDQSLLICDLLEAEDFCIQPMEDASPPKWHLAHVTWFFETFLLRPFLPGFTPFCSEFEYLFNSYYNGVGQPYPRARRGLLSRPTTDEIINYRRYVDDAMADLLGRRLDDPEVAFRTVLGLHHEQQHQELLFTDLKYNLGNNPLYPAYKSPAGVHESKTDGSPLTFAEFKGGIYEIGKSADGSFHFDNEGPRHQVLLRDYALANRLVTNGDFAEFVDAGGYEKPDLWLADGWSTLKANDICAPLYWLKRGGDWYEYHLDGVQPLVLTAPVCHVSGYEAAAFARWKKARLPTEAEWEVASVGKPLIGNFVDSGLLRPRGSQSAGESPGQMFGDCWEWTQSSYGPYPGFREFDGSLGEYNGKFMANQLVLRGGSCVTPEGHIRPTYRNFFYAKDRWQFSGIRLALGT